MSLELKMSLYNYKAVGPTGKELKGTMRGDNPEAVIEELRMAGWYPLKVELAPHQPPEIVSEPNGQAKDAPVAPKAVGRSGRAVVEPSSRSGVLILKSRDLIIRGTAVGFYVVAVGAGCKMIFSPPRSPQDGFILSVFTLMIFAIACILWISHRRATIDLQAGCLVLKSGLPNGNVLSPKQSISLDRFCAVLLCGEESDFTASINRVPVNYVGVVCLFGPYECVKVLGWRDYDAKAERAAREAAERVANLLGFPLVDETPLRLHTLRVEAGDVVPYENSPWWVEKYSALEVTLSAKASRERVEGVVRIAARRESLECQSLFVQLVERQCETKGTGHLKREIWTRIIRDGQEIPLDVVIPEGEKRFIGFSLRLPADYVPMTKNRIWGIDVRLVAAGALVAPIGINMEKSTYENSGDGGR